MILHITRHGQVLPSSHPLSVPNPNPGDPRLSALGRDQAVRTGHVLRDSGFTGTVYTSPYRRAAETAALIAETIGATAVLTPPLREMVAREGQMDDFGGANAETLCDELPGLVALTDGSSAFPAPRWWTHEVETVADVAARVARFIADLESEGTDALLVGHGATANAAIRTVLANYDSAATDFGITWNCALSSFRLTPDFEILRLTDVSHLPPEAVTSNTATPERAQVLREMNYL